MIRTIKIKLNPTVTQVALLDQWVRLCCDLYNRLRQQRIEHYEQKKAGLDVGKCDFYTQSASLVSLKIENPEYKTVNAQTLQDVAKRLDRTFQNFFRRNKVTKTGGFPRFKFWDRYKSFAFPQFQNQNCINHETRRIKLPTIGEMKFHKTGQDFPVGKIKTGTIKKLADGYWLFLTVDCLPGTQPKPTPTGKAVGLDLGLKSFVTLSTGMVLGNLAPIKASERKLRLVQRDLSRTKKGSKRSHKARRRLSVAHQKLQRSRDLQHHTISRKLVNEYDLIAVEDLEIKQMLRVKKTSSGDKLKFMSPAAKRGMRRNIGLSAWGSFVHQLVYKAEDAGKLVIKVDPRGTTQDCSRCAATIPKELRAREHNCPHCGLQIDRDFNAALNVLARGLGLNGKHSPVTDLRLSKDDLGLEV